MKMNFKNLLKTMAISAAAMTWLAASAPEASASTVNPYSHVETVSLTGEAKADYINQKMDKIIAAESGSATETAPAQTPPEQYAVPQGWRQEVKEFNGITVEVYEPEEKKSDRVVLFMHGGGYIGGLTDTYRDWGIQRAELAGNATLLMPVYRLAPEHVYPSALDDAVKAYQGILDADYAPEKITLIGDSAGGNLASALAVYARDHQMPLPKAMVLFSPWTDLGSLPSHTQNAEKDQILGNGYMFYHKEVVTPAYGKGQDLPAPHLSTSYADLKGLPPMLLIAGGDEVLLDDAALFAAHARAAGVEAQFSIYPGMSHDWMILFPELPESAAEAKEVSAFIQKHVK